MSSKPWRSLCTNVVRADASCESSMEEDTMILNACNKFVARCSCSESPESPESLESRSRMESARVKAPITSTNSPSSTCNDADSFWRTVAALFKSASFFAIAAKRPSTVAVLDSMLATALSTLALSDAISSPKMFMLCSEFAAFDLHQLAKAWYSWSDISAVTVSFASRFDSKATTLLMAVSLCATTPKAAKHNPAILHGMCSPGT
mmetsp:Transcript_37612/g.100026  ORF Transcript_37612/g.100026 Transcript_37612/m.100026 type:complete len:206 (-) Transcript_37612:43-660(-)